jgi:hypothetical protein
MALVDAALSSAGLAAALPTAIAVRLPLLGADDAGGQNAENWVAATAAFGVDATAGGASGAEASAGRDKGRSRGGGGGGSAAARRGAGSDRRTRIDSGPKNQHRLPVERSRR